MQLKDKKVLVFGAGKSGISATKLLQSQGAFVTLYDGNTNFRSMILKINSIQLIISDWLPEALPRNLLIRLI
jgi:UDP-N-acetylmuramoylalanine-D-glutamate ligase